MNRLTKIAAATLVAALGIAVTPALADRGDARGVTSLRSHNATVVRTTSVVDPAGSARDRYLAQRSGNIVASPRAVRTETAFSTSRYRPSVIHGSSGYGGSSARFSGSYYGDSSYYGHRPSSNYYGSARTHVAYHPTVVYQPVVRTVVLPRGYHSRYDSSFGHGGGLRGSSYYRSDPGCYTPYSRRSDHSRRSSLDVTLRF